MASAKIEVNELCFLTSKLAGTDFSQKAKKKRVMVYSTMKISPGLPIFPHETNKSVNLGSCDVLLQELAIVMKQCRNSVLGQNVIANLLLHEAKLLCNVFLQNTEGRRKVLQLMLRI